MQKLQNGQKLSRWLVENWKEIERWNDDNTSNPRIVQNVTSSQAYTALFRPST